MNKKYYTNIYVIIIIYVNLKTLQEEGLRSYNFNVFFILFCNYLFIYFLLFYYIFHTFMEKKWEYNFNTVLQRHYKINKNKTKQKRINLIKILTINK